MFDRDALFRAILEAPDDDAPRLVYADWLDDHDQPDRAEFIRAQVAAATVPVGTARWKPAAERAARLIREHKAAWTGPVLERVLSAECRRGFVDAVRLTVEQFEASADELLRLAPVRMWEFSTVALFVTGARFERLAEHHPAFDRVRGLAAGQYDPNALLTALADSRYLSGLQSLAVRGRFPGTGPIANLFAVAPYLTELQAEQFSHRVLNDIWQAVAPRMTRLHLIECGLDDSVLVDFLDGPAAGRLTSLVLDHNGLTEGGAAALADAPFLASLRELGLAGNLIGDAGAVSLARSPALANLEVLNLTRCRIDDAGAAALACSPYLSNLRCLCLDENRVSVEIEAALAQRFGSGVCSFSWSGGKGV